MLPSVRQVFPVAVLSEEVVSFWRTPGPQGSGPVSLTSERERWVWKEEGLVTVSGHHEQVELEIGCRAQSSWGEREEEKALPGPQQTGAPRRMGRVAARAWPASCHAD